MPKKRLENALQAGKLIQLGFSLNKSKPTDLSLLYTVDCIDKNVNYNSQIGIKKKQTDQDSDSDQDTDSSLSRFEKTNDYEKIEVLSLQFNQNQNILATGDSNGEINIYDVFSGNPISTEREEKISNKPQFYDSLFKNSKISISNVYNMPIICMKWHPYSNYTLNYLYYAHVNGYIGILDKENFKKSILIEENDEISCIDFNKDGSTMASVGKDYSIKLYDSNFSSNSNLHQLVKTYGCNTSIEEKGSIFTSISSALASILSSSPSSTTHTNRLQAVKFSNVSNDILYTGGWDRTVKIWDKRTQNGYVNSLQGPFVCGSDAIDVNDYLVLTASWVKQNALDLWDIRKFKKVCNLPIATNETKPGESEKSLSEKLKLKENNVNEYLYACKFFSSSNHESNKTNYSTVLACGSGTQSLHLLDYEKPNGKQLLSSISCQSPLYCLDAIYSCSLIACGGMKKFYTMMANSEH